LKGRAALSGYVGKTHRFRGRVIKHGRDQGTRIGFPTALVAEVEMLFPASGDWVPVCDHLWAKHSQDLAGLRVGERAEFSARVNQYRRNSPSGDGVPAGATDYSLEFPTGVTALSPATAAPAPLPAGVPEGPPDHEVTAVNDVPANGTPPANDHAGPAAGPPCPYEAALGVLLPVLAYAERCGGARQARDAVLAVPEMPRDVLLALLDAVAAASPDCRR
jgi:hypothetical protein